MEIQTELLILLLTGFPLSHTIAQTTDTTSLSSTIEDVGVYHVCQAPALGIQFSPNVLRSRSALECGRQCSQSAQCRGVTVCPDRGVDGGVVCEIKEVMPNVLCSHDNQPDEGCYFMKKVCSSVSTNLIPFHQTNISQIAADFPRRDITLNDVKHQIKLKKVKREHATIHLRCLIYTLPLLGYQVHI